MTSADKGARFGNLIIDISLVLIIYVIVSLIIVSFSPTILEEDNMIFEVIFTLIFFSYYFFLELLFGRTIGKVLTKTMVVNRQGYKPKPLTIFFRTLVRLVPTEGLTFLFGHIGLHDLLSKTTVVKVKKTVAN